MPAFGTGLLYTVMLAFFAVIIGFVIALLLAFMRLSKLKILRFISGAYVEIVRGTPMLVQLMIVYYGIFGVITVPSFMIFGFIDSSRFIPGVIAIAFNSAGYVAEIIRGGIQGVDYGQTEAARSLGLKQGQNMRFIVLPQAVKNILPAIANEFVTIIKESSVCTLLGMAELMFTAKLVQSQSLRIMEPLLVAACLYFLLTFPTSKAIQAIERRMRRGDER
ncbi:MAG: amino acid ABC transporter permease [Oscillospiraceae bacterium]